MLIEFCASNYLKSDDLANGVDGIVKDYIDTLIRLLWINVFNVQIGFSTRIEYSHMYYKKNSLDKSWTPIKQKIAKIQIGSNLSHIITRIQFHVQLVVAQIIHCPQGLTLDRLGFDPINLTQHGFIYTT